MLLDSVRTWPAGENGPWPTRWAGPIDGRFDLFRIVARAIKHSMAGINYSRPSGNTGGGLDFEAQLWAAADKMRGHMDASEYKHVALGLIFLKYISDAFEEKREQLLFGFSDPKSEWFIKEEPDRAKAAEDRDEYLAANVFWLPPEARWHTIKAKARSPEIGIRQTSRKRQRKPSLSKLS